MNDGIYKMTITAAVLASAGYIYSTLNSCGLKSNKQGKMMFVLLILILYVIVDVWTSHIIDKHDETGESVEGFFKHETKAAVSATSATCVLNESGEELAVVDRPDCSTLTADRATCTASGNCDFTPAQVATAEEKISNANLLQAGIPFLTSDTKLNLSDMSHFWAGDQNNGGNGDGTYLEDTIFHDNKDAKDAITIHDRHFRHFMFSAVVSGSLVGIYAMIFGGVPGVANSK